MEDVERRNYSASRGWPHRYDRGIRDMRSTLTVIFCGVAAGVFMGLAAMDPRAIEAAESFYPHVQACLAGNPIAGLMLSIGNALTFSAYFMIAGCIAYMSRIIGVFNYPVSHWAPVAVRILIQHAPLFAGFILFCGVGHLWSFINLYSTLYWFEAAWSLFGTGFISFLTAFAFLRSTLRFEEELIEGANYAEPPAIITRSITIS